MEYAGLQPLHLARKQKTFLVRSNDNYCCTLQQPWKRCLRFPDPALLVALLLQKSICFLVLMFGFFSCYGTELGLRACFACSRQADKREQWSGEWWPGGSQQYPVPGCSGCQWPFQLELWREKKKLAHHVFLGYVPLNYKRLGT